MWVARECRFHARFAGVLLGIGLSWLACRRAGGAVPAGGQALTVAANGTARAVVVVAADAGPAEKHAAEELAGFLGQVTGGKFRIVHRVAPGLGNLLVGPKAARLVDPDFSTQDLGDEGIVIRTVGRDLILAGGAPRGTLYAVYTFLEEHVGCHWWTPTESTIPRKPTLAVPSLDIRYVPPFEYRSTNYPRATDPDFSVRNKFNGHDHRLFVDDGFHNTRQDLKRGGRKYAFPKSDKWWCGTFWTYIPPEIYLKDHPEWFAAVPAEQVYMDDVYYGIGADGLPKVGGKMVRPRSLEEFSRAPFRPYTSLCLTNEAMRRELVRSARLALTWYPAATWLSVSQVDGMNPCRCDKCMAVAREEGAYSGVMIRFVNVVADDLALYVEDLAKYTGRPLHGMPIVTEAYHYTRKPPEHARPRDNVIVLLVTAYDFIKPDRSSELWHGKPLSDERNKGFREDCIGWSKICKRLYIWYYLDNHGNWLLPYPNLRALDADVKFFAAHKVKGVFAETLAKSVAGWPELRAWLWAKLLWNPALDGQKLIEEFAGGYYGPAGDHIVAYLTLMHDAMEASGEWMGQSSGPDAKYLSFGTLKKSWSHLQAAEMAVWDDPVLRLRVQVAQLPVLYAFMLRWGRMRQQAKEAGVEWPLADSLQEVFNRFMTVVKKRRITGLEERMMTPQMLECKKRMELNK